jgi:hypothetical protein
LAPAVATVQAIVAICVKTLDKKHRVRRHGRRKVEDGRGVKKGGGSTRKRRETSIGTFDIVIH